ncbi:MAG: hypothetical protein JW772_04995 [Candidatus Diapherotrites archaeon]|nr:hypothetical protein [Candidatus Diapherotrites archaeon]
MAVKKKGKKSVKKKLVKTKARPRKKAAKRTAPKKATVKSLKSLAKKSAKTDASLKSELAKLKQDVSNLQKKPKVKKRMVNEYNLFMRKQLRSGRTFKQAVLAWNRFKKLQSKKKPSAYNSFMASQLKQGRSFKEAVALWKKFGRESPATFVRTTALARTISPKKRKPAKKQVAKKKPVRKAKKRKPARKRSKPKRKTIVRTKIKRVIVRPKPIIKYRTRVVEKPVAAPVVEKPIVLPAPRPEETAMIHEAKTIEKEKILEKIKEIEKSVPEKEDVSAEMALLKAASRKDRKLLKDLEHGLPVEELANRLLSVYFEDLARKGFKRSITLEELVKVYTHLLERLEVRLGNPKKSLLHEEEVAYRIVKLYFLELANHGLKRTMSIDELTDAYFFVLNRINK